MGQSLAVGHGTPPLTSHSEDWCWSHALQRPVFALLVTAISICTIVLAPTGARAAEKPNMIFILADDLGYGDLGCFGQSEIQTPRLDQMAKEGMRFTQFYAGNTVCAQAEVC